MTPLRDRFPCPWRLPTARFHLSGMALALVGLVSAISSADALVLCLNPTTHWLKSTIAGP